MLIYDDATIPGAYGALRDRKALVAIDLRTTGVTYFKDGTPNADSVPFQISMVTSVLDDDNRPVVLDALNIRVAAPGFILVDAPIPGLMSQMRAFAYSSQSVSLKEKARLDAREFLGDEIQSLPTIEVRSQDYDPDDKAHGLSRQEASGIIKNYIGRFEGGAVIAGENLCLIYAMLDRIGVHLEVIPNVYHRTIEMYTIFLTAAIASGQFTGLSEIPSLDEVMGLNGTRDSMVRAQAITQYLTGVGGPGSLPPQLWVPNTQVDFGRVDAGAEATEQVIIGNGGLGGEIEVSITTSGSECFEVVSADTTIEAGQTGLITVRCAPPVTGEHYGTINLSSGGVTKTIDLSVTAKPAIGA